MLASKYVLQQGGGPVLFTAPVELVADGDRLAAQGREATDLLARLNVALGSECSCCPCREIIVFNTDDGDA